MPDPHRLIAALLDDRAHFEQVASAALDVLAAYRGVAGPEASLAEAARVLDAAGGLAVAIDAAGGWSEADLGIAAAAGVSEEDRRHRRIPGGVAFAFPAHLVGDQRAAEMTDDDFAAIGRQALGITGDDTGEHGHCDHEWHDPEAVGRRVLAFLLEATGGR